jgi:NADPH-dependent 2,4-dienoyl-CoA reductase/sulfur reductase-like enzyme
MTFLEQNLKDCVMTKLLIIGGSDAGISAALRAREFDAGSEVTVVVADRFPNYSICGLPFYLSSEVPDWHRLAHRTKEEITGKGIHLLLDHTAKSIDAANQAVTVTNSNGQVNRLRYDRLIIATGAAPVRPNLPDIALPGVYLLRTMEDSFAVNEHLRTNNPRSAVIVGGGYIGMEMADALTHRGLAVAVVEHGEYVLKTVDQSLGQIVSDELRRHHIQVITSVRVEGIAKVGTQLSVIGSQGFQIMADLVLVAVGVQPQTEVAKNAGIELGLRDAIRVTRAMETNVPDIFAAGDCVETWHRLLNQPTYLPLGTTAHKQGRVAGENALGGHQYFAGTLGTQVVKVFETVVARTGLRDDEARKAGFDPLTIESTNWDHKVYYPDAHTLCIRVTGDRKSGRLLGAQIVGHWHTEVAKRIDIFATALFHHMSIDDLNHLDLSYTPPVSSPWDAIQMSAQEWVRAQ